MPDISMCANSKCPSSRLCYRYMAVPTANRQAYASFAPVAGTQECAYFTPIEFGNKLRKVNGRVKTKSASGKRTGERINKSK